MTDQVNDKLMAKIVRRIVATALREGRVLYEDNR